jgi:hypothetical protein
LLKVKVEQPNALRFILQDDLYLLEEDKLSYNSVPALQPKIETPQQNFNYLGANKKNFLILAYYPDHEFIHADHLTALESVLTRIGHHRDDVAILNIAKIATEYESLAAHFNPKTLLILGEASLVPGIKPPPFNQRQSNDGLNILYTFSFDAMMSSTDNKKAFWEQMKTL